VSVFTLNAIFQIKISLKNHKLLPWQNNQFYGHEILKWVQQCYSMDIGNRGDFLVHRIIVGVAFKHLALALEK